MPATVDNGVARGAVYRKAETIVIIYFKSLDFTGQALLSLLALIE